MLINFIGAPGSGKSTIAANTFAKLKSMSIPADFISERAREVIAKYKFKKMPLGSDEMQIEILEAQYRAETYFKNSTDYPVIADSSTLLTLAYGTETFFKLYSDRINTLVDSIIPEMDMVFYIPLRNEVQEDPNRIHNYDQCLEVDRKIKEIISNYLVTSKHIKLVILSGGIEEMTRTVLRTIIEEVGDGQQTDK
jgi:adenylate kinase family enzyme